MKLNKWKIGIVVLVALGVWWFIETAPKRKVAAEFKNLVRVANRQEVEIAIIKQAVELQQLKSAIRKAQDAKKTIPEVKKDELKDTDS